MSCTFSSPVIGTVTGAMTTRSIGRFAAGATPCPRSRGRLPGVLYGAAFCGPVGGVVAPDWFAVGGFAVAGCMAARGGENGW